MYCIPNSNIYSLFHFKTPVWYPLSRNHRYAICSFLHQKKREKRGINKNSKAIYISSFGATVIILDPPLAFACKPSPAFDSTGKGDDGTLMCTDLESSGIPMRLGRYCFAKDRSGGNAAHEMAMLLSMALMAAAPVASSTHGVLAQTLTLGEVTYKSRPPT